MFEKTISHFRVKANLSWNYILKYKVIQKAQHTAKGLRALAEMTNRYYVMGQLFWKHCSKCHSSLQLLAQLLLQALNYLAVLFSLSPFLLECIYKKIWAWYLCQMAQRTISVIVQYP